MIRTITPEQNLQLALDIRRGHWFLHDAEALLPMAAALLERREVLFENTEREFCIREFDIEGRDIASAQKRPDTQCVAVIPISGTITKYDSCGTIGTATYSRALLDAAAEPTVVAAVLDIDSGGGVGGAVPLLLDAIRQFQATEKPLLAHVDFCASAAYWIASSCDAIFCDNRTASAVGSIGAYCSIIDDKGALEKDGYKIHEIYARESTEKNRPYREALNGQYALIEEQLSHIVQSFHADVKAGRPTLKADAAGVLTGAMFFAEEAASVGLIDGVSTLREVVDNAFVRASINSLK